MFSSHFKTKKIESVYLHQQTFRHFCSFFDEVSAILQALHIRALLSRTSGKMKFDSSSWYVKTGLLRFEFVEIMLEFFLQTRHFVPWLQKSVLEIPKTKTVLTVDIKSSFFSALRASLTRLRCEPSVSRRKQYPLEPRVHILLNHKHIRQER